MSARSGTGQPAEPGRRSVGSGGSATADGPGPGSSYNDFWEKTDGIWVGKQLGSSAVRSSFAAQVFAVGGPPELAIRRGSDGTTIKLSWPQDGGSNCHLETAETFGSRPVWKPLSEPIQIEGDSFVVTLPATGNQVFRLGCP